MKEKYKNILLIDPVEKHRKDLSLYFTHRGYHVAPCGNLTDAFLQLDHTPFHCVIMDVQQSGMKGYEAVPLLKSINSNIHIIMTAEKNSKTLEAKVRNQDIYYYYIKSFDKKELNLAVKNIFKEFEKETEMKMKNQPINILIVDDDNDYSDATRIILEKNDYHVDVAHTKEEAMEKVNQFKPNLIILDIMMERMTDGFTICYQLKHHPELKKIPIMALSGITSKTGLKFSPKTDGEYFQADDYAEKPIEPEELLHRISELLNN